MDLRRLSAACLLIVGAEAASAQQSEVVVNGDIVVAPRYWQSSRASSASTLSPSGDWRVIDVGILYTPAMVAEAARGLAQVQQLNRDYVDYFNTVLARSRMKVIARLVGQAQVDYTESGNIFTDLANLANGSEAGTGPFASWRDLWGADLLMLAVEHGGAGVAQLGGPYSVVGSHYLGAYTCETGGVLPENPPPPCVSIPTHEWGHNLWLQHNPGAGGGNIDDCRVYVASSVFRGLCERGHAFCGYLPNGDCFGDIMAYVGGGNCLCTPGSSAHSIHQYSNPQTLYGSVRLGEYGVAEGAAVGEAWAETAQTWKPTRSASSCTQSPDRLCLNQGRFMVTAYYKTLGSGEGYGSAVPFGGDSGMFTFFDPGNLELTIKVLDWCTLNGKFAVFIAAMTDVEVSVLVLDTKTGATKTYSNPQSRVFQAVQDPAAFPACN